MQFTVEYPDRLPDAMRMSRAEFEQEARMAMAVKLFELGRLSSGQAAQLAGLERAAFIMSLHRYGVSPIQLSTDELEDDMRHA
jgi:predicted HTH domain antitoxin